ncbi:MAG: hypothetical protein DSY60_05150 [Persephonella sp.]|nr:MAG: hypothetical protein DSY60_05150 [Persephonella sp.]
MKQEILKLYEKEGLFKNRICLECRKSGKEKNYYPLGFWQVGKLFDREKIRIIFAGKPHRGNLDSKIIKEENFLVADVNQIANDLFFNKNWPYWSYTKEILKKVYNTDDKGAWDRLAFTNVIKCSLERNERNDNTPDYLKQFCLKEFGIFWKEILLLKPTHVVLYLGKHYDEYINNETIKSFIPAEKIDEITSNDYYIQVGKKICWWWHRIIYLSNKEINILRVCHPERKKKVDFTNEIVKWINKTS